MPLPVSAGRWISLWRSGLVVVTGPTAPCCLANHWRPVLLHTGGRGPRSRNVSSFGQNTLPCAPFLTYLVKSHPRVETGSFSLKNAFSTLRACLPCSPELAAY